jgi:CO/xanthine dehydrogenase Mo-binding subunit
MKMAIGRPEARVDAPGKVTGSARYPADLAQPGDLVARVVFSDRPHARMLALDAREALATPGVVAVLTAEDVPHNAYGLVIRDQPVLVGADAGSGAVAANVSRWEGDHIAVVIAESEAAARRAGERIRAAWDDLPVLGDVDTAKCAATLIHPECEAGSNAYSRLVITKGDLAAGWRAAEVTVAGTYLVPHQEHAFMQPEAARSYVDEEGRVTVEIAGQWAHEDRAQIAHALGLEPDRVRVRYPAIGGAFGGREDVSLQIVMALAAWRLAERGDHRPIRTQWSREESIRGHGKGHWTRIAARWGATRAGRITAVEASVDLDAGAYNYTSNVLLKNTLSFLGGAYDVPNARLEGSAIYTNNVPGAALRGFGAPQACFAAEGQMNKLAAALALDPVALRRSNALRAGECDITGAPLPEGLDVISVMDTCAEASARRDASRVPAREPNGFTSLPPDPTVVRRGRGFACGIKNVGYSFGSPEGCEVALELDGRTNIERVQLRYGGAEVGQGTHTVVRQMVAEAVGVPVHAVELAATDTALAADAGSASASRLTVMAGQAVRLAAERARERWQAGDRPARGEARFTPPPTTPLGAGASHIAFGPVAEAVEVGVDLETGDVRVDRVVCADDVGRAINPALARGQVEGGIVQALGGALLENLQLAEGRILNPRLSEYWIPAIGDAPEVMETILVENPDPIGPWGARGIGEMPFLPLAAAIAAALHDATGVWFDELPLTPERVCAKLRAHGVVA